MYNARVRAIRIFLRSHCEAPLECTIIRNCVCGCLAMRPNQNLNLFQVRNTVNVVVGAFAPEEGMGAGGLGSTDPGDQSKY